MIEGNEEEIMGDMGTKTFLPPEHFLGKQVKGRLADIWASGITFYMLAFGSPPFKGKTLD
jgi:[calcium/calmodulin-dependent protein kinase] kinase